MQSASMEAVSSKLEEPSSWRLAPMGLTVGATYEQSRVSIATAFTVMVPLTRSTFYFL